MKRSGLALLLLVLSAPALAQRAQLGFTALGSPLDAHAVLERTSRHACSRSYASSSGRATLELTVDRSGGVRLVLDGRSDETSGSRMDHSSSHTFHLHRVELSGTAHTSGATMTLRLTSAASGMGWWEGFGTAPAPTLTSAPVDVTLECSLSTEDVLPSAWTEGETADPERLLRCELEAGELPSAFDSYGEAPFFFGSAGPVVNRVEQGILAIHEGRVLRRAP